jgi:hypothetical protein
VAYASLNSTKLSRMQCRLTRLSIAVGLLVIALLPAAGASAKRWDYLGHFEGHPNWDVKLKLAKGKVPGSKRRMIVNPVRYEETCDNGKTKMESGFPFGAPFRSGNHFYRRLETYYLGPHSATYGDPFYETGGRLSADKDKVNGFFRFQDDHPPIYGDPVPGYPPTPPPDPPDCSTDGRLRFKATDIDLLPPPENTVHRVRPGAHALQRAVDRAEPGDTLKLRFGHYRDPVEIDKPLTIRASREGGVVIDGECQRQSMITVTAPDVVIKGIQVFRTGAPDQHSPAAIRYIGNGGGQLGAYMFLPCGTGDGVEIAGSSPVVIKDSEITDYRGSAVRVIGSSDPGASVSIEGQLRATDNSNAVLVEGARRDQAVSLTGIVANATDQDASPRGIVLRDSDGVQIESSSIYGSAGIWLDASSDDNVLNGNAGSFLRNDGQRNCGSGNSFDSTSGQPLMDC